MMNFELARLFEQMADVLELKGENPFRIRAYRSSEDRGARGRTSHLVVGEAPGTKFATARRLGVPILGEAEFLRLVEETR